MHVYKPVSDQEPTPEIWSRIFWASHDLKRTFSDPEDPRFKKWTRTFGAAEWTARYGLVEASYREQPAAVGMVLNPELRCGIREHTGYFQEHLLTRCFVLSQNPKASDHTEILLRAREQGIKLLHVQHEFSLFREWAALTKLLVDAKQAGIRTIFDVHTGPQPEDWRKALVGWCTLADRVVTHSALTSSFLADLSPVEIPLAVPDAALWHPAADDALVQDGPVVGTVGFFNMHKGFSELAQAMGSIRGRHPNTKLLILGNSVNKAQDQYQAKVAQIPNTHIIHDFLPVESLVRTLAACDIVVLPYRVNVESQSGAVETALLSGRPVLISESTMFKHIPAECFIGTCPTEASPGDLASAVVSALDKHIRPPYAKAVQRRMLERRGSKIAACYDALYQGLLC